MSSGEAYDNKGLDHTILKVEIKSNSGKGSSLSSNCEFIFVLDISGSMGVYVNEILTKVFPKVYDKLNFPENKIIHLLTFEDSVEYYTYNKNDFKNSTIHDRACTYMSEIPYQLENILNKYNSDKSICLLTLSDGIIGDQDETQENAANLVKKLNGRFTNLNSQAIRFMSSDYAQPDTRALCSLLQLNSNLQNNSNILLTFNPVDTNNNNYSMSDNKCEELATEISKLFQISEGSGWILKSNGNKKFKVEPYGQELSFLELPKGKTSLFIDSVCSSNISNDFSLSTGDNSEKASLYSKGEVTQSNLYQVYQDSIEKLMKKVIINKGIKTSDSKNNNDKIINFINILENKTPGTKGSNNKLTQLFQNINNDQTTNNLNGNQLNDYINQKLNECKESIDSMVNEEVNNNKKEKLNEFIILIDASEKMENYIKKLQEILYETAKYLGFEENKKIRIYPFNGEDPGYSSVAVKKLKKFTIDCESSRDLFNTFQNVAELIFYNSDKNYKILTITSGEFIFSDDIRALFYKLNQIKNFPSLKSEIVVFKTPNSDFNKNDKNEDQYDYITFSLIKQFGFEDIIEYKPLIINYNDDTKNSAEKISKLFS
jgi:hypothetical protein